MKSTFSSVILTALLFSAPLHGDSTEQNLKQALSGQRLLVTYREGGAFYGTYYFLDVHFCPSGSYMTMGRSNRGTVLGNTQVNNFSDQGRWAVAAFNGRTFLRSQSASGQTRTFPLAVLPDGGIWLGNGISVVPQGAALCR